MIRLGYLVPEFPGQTHGFFRREIEALERHGIEIDLVSTRRPREHVGHPWAEGLTRRTTYLVPLGPAAMLSSVVAQWRTPLWRMPSVAGGSAAWRGEALRSRFRVCALVLVAGWLAAMARRRRWTHLHVHSLADSALLAAMARWMGGAPYSVTLHGPLSSYGPVQEIKWSRSAFGITVTSHLRDEVLREVEGIDRSSISVAPMGIDGTLFRRRTPYAAASRQGTLRLVTCGRLHRGKGHADLVEAVGCLRGEGRDVTLTIIGDGPDRATIESAIERADLIGSVSLVGRRSEREVRDALEQAHLFVLASRQEAIGVATMEAMAMALPVVVTGVGDTLIGVAELVREGIDGLLVAPHDPAAMAAAIGRLHDDPLLATRLGASGAERTHRYFTADRGAAVLAERIGTSVRDEVDSMEASVST